MKMTNQTREISGLKNETIFSVNLTDDRNYIWNCIAYDQAGNNNWSSENRTLIIRDDPPVLLAVGANNTNPLPNEYVQFYSQWTDDENLSNFIFSWQTGGELCNQWVNNTPVAFNSISNPGNWTNTTMQIPATCNNKLINFSFWANDSENQWNQIIEPIAVGCIVNITYYQYPTVSFLNETIEIIGFEAGDIIVAPYYQAVNASIDYGLTTSYGGYTENKTFKQRHEFNLSGLTPNKKYFYRVNLAYDLGSCHYTDNKFNSSFNTSDDTDTSFTFAVIGDMRAQAGTGVQTNIFSKLTSYIMQRNPDFVINVGDVVESQQSGLGDNYSIARSAWKEYTDVVWNLTDHIPTFISIGNHEHPGTQNSLKRYREVVIHPQNGNGSNDAGCYQNNCYNETTYWFRYGNSLFVSLNTEEKPDRNIANITGNQYKWFNQTVNQTGYTHKFVFAHRPLAGTNRSDSLFGKDPTWSAHLDELMYNNGVTAAFYGHEHTYCKNTTHNGEMLHVIS